MAKYAAFGTLIKAGNAASPEVFTTIAAVGDFSGPKLKQETADVTNHNNATRWREFITTLKEAGEIDLDLFYDPNDTTQNFIGSQALGTLFNSGAANNFQIVLPPTISPQPKWSFTAFVIGFENEYKVNGPLMAKVKLKITSSVSFG